MTTSRPTEYTALAHIESWRQKKLRTLQDVIAQKLTEAKSRNPSAKWFEVKVDYDSDHFRLAEVSEVLARFDSQHAVDWRTEDKAIKVRFR